ncbi:MAG: DNA internalization-related competence protein ComEC/Rec2 [Chloroflexi bacterium]|nr:DNA internalization-related competence protein ComEC/Rec2 [Chloroflexota bacterium]
MRLFYLSAAWVAGIFLGSITALPWWLAPAAALATLAGCLIRRPRRQVGLVIGLSAAALLAAAAYASPVLHRELDGLSRYHGQAGVTLRGLVSEEPAVSDKSAQLSLSSLEIEQNGAWRPVPGSVLVFAPVFPAYGYGDRLLVTGRLQAPAPLGDFDYPAYLSRRGVATVSYFPRLERLATGQASGWLSLIYGVRRALAGSLARALPEPQASLAQALALGLRTGLPADLKAEFVRSGAAHLLAVSGLHISIVTGVMLGVGLWLFGRRRYLYIWLALGAVWLYALLSGMQPPVVRGSIMASLFLAAEALGRQRSAVTALALAAAVMTAFDPFLLWDASFQLSFAAMAGLVLLYPVFLGAGGRLTGLIPEDRAGLVSLARVVNSGLSATLAATLAVLPLVAYHFGAVPLVGAATTLLALPALPGAIITAALTGLAGLPAAPLAQVMGWAAWLFLSYIIAVVQFFAGLPFAAAAVGSFSGAFVWLYYAAFLLVMLAARQRRPVKDLLQRARRRAPALGAPAGAAERHTRLLIGGLALTALLVFVSAATLPDNRLRVTFLDVGQGDAILIQRGSQQVLIDGGPSSRDVAAGLGGRMPFWDRTIELVVLTHPHQDHLAGLVEVARRFKVERVLYPEIDLASPLYDEWRAVTRDVTRLDVAPGQRIDLGGGAVLDLLGGGRPASPDESDVDDSGLVLRLSLDGVSFLLTGDISADVERELVRDRAVLTSTVLKVAHHGSNTSTSAEFLSVVNPGVAVISVGAGNSFGHPGAGAMSRLSARPSLDVYRTDEHGAVEMTTDGENLWSRTTR